MAYISDYRDGTVSLTTGTRALVGDGTAWTAIGLQPGDMFMVGGFVALIETVVDETHITLRDDWGGPTLPAGSSYSIKFSPDQSRVQASVVDLIRRLSNGNIDALTELTLEADRLIYADGPNSLALTTLTAYGRGLLAAEDAASMMVALGASAIGAALLTAADPGAAQDAIGATAVGKAVLAAADQAAGRTAIGAAGATAVAASFAGVDAELAAVDAELGKRLRFDALQSLTPAEQGQARANIGADDAANLTKGTLLDARVSETLPADKAFRRGNILGTVSQSGGVPTGAIIERGSNANGEFVRFADGTQICTRITNVTFDTTPNGPIYYSGNQTWTFPAAFAATATITGSVHISGRLGWLANPGNGADVTNTTLTIILPTSGTGITATMRLVAVGRWF